MQQTQQDENKENHSHAHVVDLLTRVLAYFDSRLPVWQRAQIATHAILEAKKYLSGLERAA